MVCDLSCSVVVVEDDDLEADHEPLLNEQQTLNLNGAMTTSVGLSCAEGGESADVGFDGQRWGFEVDDCVHRVVVPDGLYGDAEKGVKVFMSVWWH